MIKSFNVREKDDLYSNFKIQLLMMRAKLDGFQSQMFGRNLVRHDSEVARQSSVVPTSSRVVFHTEMSQTKNVAIDLLIDRNVPFDSDDAHIDVLTFPNKTRVDVVVSQNRRPRVIDQSINVKK